MLSDSQVERYSRQIILPQVGGKGQEKLLHARVLVNGSGLLQSTALLYLAAAGIGTIGIISDLPFPLLSALSGDPEISVFEVLSSLNPDCAIIVHTPGTPHSEELIQRYDLVLSGPDSLHDLCYTLHKPFLCTRVSAEEAWLLCCRGYEQDSPCLRCVTAFMEEAHELPPHRSTAAYALSAMLLGTLQATEAIKLVLGLHHTAAGKWWRCQFPGLYLSESIVKKNPVCVLCGQPASSNRQSL